MNFSIQIARALGCNPIIIIGTDLAFSNQEYYAEGIAAHLNLTENDLKIHDSDPPPILEKDIYGQPIYTLWKWMTEARWISTFAVNHPESIVINATEGGLGFKGIPNLSLKEAADQYLTKAIDIEKINQNIHSHAFKDISVERIKELMLQMKESLDECIQFLSKLLAESDHVSECIKQGLPFESDTPASSMTLLQTKMEEQIGYQYLLENFSQLYLRLHHRYYQDLQSPKKGMSKKKRALMKLELEKQRFVFLRDAAHINRDLILHTLK